mmetsp:Transcript_23179/g.22656  ORF Transcript_23179/g.22656 Transcript_23179/m.22656 type:complete len:364 (-) Transcript_23179:642-1733(-)
MQALNKNWSDLLILRALKKKLPVNRATFLKHGKTYTIIKKEESEFNFAFDINLKPPVLLKNCLPVPITIRYTDSNGDSGQLELLKEEEKHIFVFDLQENLVFFLGIENFQESQILLDCTNSKEQEIKHTIFDIVNKELDLYINTSAKIAGKKVTFYVKNCVINNTQQELVFFYRQPSFRQLQQKTSNDIVAGMKEMRKMLTSNKKVYMLKNENELYVGLGGTLEVSNPINIKNPGCQEKFGLTKEDFLYEFGYSTEMFLATKDDYVYTKITTISPLYVIINQTKNLLVVGQHEATEVPFVIRNGDRVPFYWANKNAPKNICFKSVSETLEMQAKSVEFDWSSGFPISELGSFSIVNREIQFES